MEDNKFTFGTPAFEVLIEKKAIPRGLRGSIQEIVIEDELNMPTMFCIKTTIFHDMQLDPNSAPRNQRIDKKLFDLVKPGQDVVVKMGLNRAETMVKGEIACLEADFESESMLTIRGYDELYRLRFGTKRRAFKKKKDSAVVGELARDNGLGVKADDTKVIHPFLWQNNQSDYEFLLERAERLDYEFLVQDGELQFFSPKEKDEPELTLTFRKDLVDFRARLKTLTQGDEVDVRSPGYRRGNVISSKARQGDERVSGDGESGFELSSSGFKKSAITVMDEPLVDAQDAEILARAKYNRILKNYITGEGSTSGNPKIRAGKTIRLENLGERFTGIYYITSTVHTLRSGMYQTSFKVRRAGI